MILSLGQEVTSFSMVARESDVEESLLKAPPFLLFWTTFLSVSEDKVLLGLKIQLLSSEAGNNSSSNLR